MEELPAATAPRADRVSFSRLLPTAASHPGRHRDAPLALPAAKDRPLLDRMVPDLSAAEAADVFERGGLPVLASLVRMRLALAAAEQRGALFVVGHAAAAATCVALLAAVGLGMPQGAPAAPFAIACAGILLGFSATYLTLTLPIHRTIVPPGFASPADPDLVAAQLGTLAWYWIRTGRVMPEGAAAGAFLEHRNPPDDWSPLEGYYTRDGKDADGKDAERAGGTQREGFRQSPSCPCPECLGFFSAGGLPVLAFFVSVHYLLAPILSVLGAVFCFWDILGSGRASPLWTQPWVTACFALHVLGLLVTCTVAPAGGLASPMQAVASRVVGAAHLRAAQASCDEFVTVCADLVRAALAPPSSPPPPPPSRPEGPSPTPAFPLPELYARVASDVQSIAEDAVHSIATVVHRPLAGCGLAAAGALLFLRTHRDSMLRAAADPPRARFLGFVVSYGSLANLAVAAVTVCATLFRAFGLRLELGTYCPGG
ncbi:hypothetical protein DFJ74DRAFT_708948 [Hyaloraphidium curvatum]|nr:hypothetical protein DFJ74DRAFT_708948 [Hyaloraphidium curvatum]